MFQNPLLFLHPYWYNKFWILIIFSFKPIWPNIRFKDLLSTIILFLDSMTLRYAYVSWKLRFGSKCAHAKEKNTQTKTQIKQENTRVCVFPNNALSKNLYSILVISTKPLHYHSNKILSSVIISNADNLIKPLLFHYTGCVKKPFNNSGAGSFYIIKRKKLSINICLESFAFPFSAFCILK